MNQENRKSKRLILAGAGLDHLEVIRRIARWRDPELEVLLVHPTQWIAHPDMIPGYIAGQYTSREITIDLAAACARAGVTHVQGTPTRIDAQQKVLFSESRAELPYDWISLDLPAEYSGLSEELRSHPDFFVSWPALQLEKLHAWDAIVADDSIYVIGAGGRAIELASAFRARYPKSRVVLCCERNALTAIEIVALNRIKVEISITGKITAVEAGESFTLATESGNRYKARFVVWATGLSGNSFYAASELSSEDGHLRVSSRLQAEGHEDVFATGETALLGGDVLTPQNRRRAHVLTASLHARIRGKSAKTFRPSRRSWSLLSTAHGGGIASVGRFQLSGRWVWLARKWRDRLFIRRHTLQSKPLHVQSPGVHGGKPLAVHQEENRQYLFAMEQFKNFGLDPYLFGRIAALSACAEIHAKGLFPQVAIVAISMPKYSQSYGENWLDHLRRGFRSVLDAEHVTAVSEQVKEEDQWGLSFTFWAQSSDFLWEKKGASVGDLLVLTKPLGEGVLLAAAAAKRSVGASFGTCVQSMALGGAEVVQAARKFPVHACNAVKESSLIGHLKEMLDDKQGADLFWDKIPFYPDAKALFQKGFRSPLHELNKSSFPEAVPEVLYDPQTSGAFLFALDERKAEELVAALGGSYSAAVIGRVTDSGRIATV